MFGRAGRAREKFICLLRTYIKQLKPQKEAYPLICCGHSGSRHSPPPPSLSLISLPAPALTSQLCRKWALASPSLFLPNLALAPAAGRTSHSPTSKALPLDPWNTGNTGDQRKGWRLINNTGPPSLNFLGACR